jgi:hypothetical protein
MPARRMALRRNLRAFALAIVWVVASAMLALAQTPGETAMGWLGLFSQDLVEWLENENQLQRLCSGFAGAEAEQCRDQKLAPKIHLVRLWAAPSTTASPSGSLLLVALPGRGLRAFFVPVTGGVATEFQPDLFDNDWGYGPYFHETFLERRGTWFRLPEEPFPVGTWVDSRQLGGEPQLQLLEPEQIVSSPFGDLFILGVDRDVLRARPEQDADMWCREGPAPALSPWRELRIPLRDLYTAAGHLVVRKKYTRGC